MYAGKRVAKSLNYYHELSDTHKKYLYDFEDNCKNLLKCIEHNSKLFEEILDDVENMFANSDDLQVNRILIQILTCIIFIAFVKGEKNTKQPNYSTISPDIDRVCTTLKQIVRDWSAEGADEREMCYNPILRELKHLFLREKRFRYFLSHKFCLYKFISLLK